jgi:hypothetical protein
MSALEKVTKLGKEKYRLEVKFKDESLFMKILGKILFFNPRFMTNYTTTIGNTVYFANRKWLAENEDSAAHVLAHELIHIKDSEEVGFLLFSYTYLFPQVLALLSLFAIFSSLWWLLCLLFLAPVPSPIRTYWELRGYAITDATCYRSTGRFTDIDWMAGQFTSGSYFFMWPFADDIRSRIEANRQLIKQGQLSNKIDNADEIIACF